MPKINLLVLQLSIFNHMLYALYYITLPSFVVSLSLPSVVQVRVFVFC